MNPDRKTIASLLSHRVGLYYARKGWSAHKEVAVEPYGRRRADMIVLNMRGELIIVEVKSCWADYSTDKKMHLYLPYCNAMYICAVPELAARIKAHLATLPERKNIGVMAVNLEANPYRAVRVVKRTGPRQKLKGEVKRKIITRIAFRCGLHEKFCGGNL